MTVSEKGKLVFDNKSAMLVIDNKSIFPSEKENVLAVDDYLFIIFYFISFAW